MARFHAAAERGSPALGGWGRGGEVPFPPSPSSSSTSSTKLSASISSSISASDDLLDIRRLTALEDKDILCVYSPQDLKVSTDLSA